MSDYLLSRQLVSLPHPEGPCLACACPDWWREHVGPWICARCSPDETAGVERWPHVRPLEVDELFGELSADARLAAEEKKRAKFDAEFGVPAAAQPKPKGSLWDG